MLAEVVTEEDLVDSEYLTTLLVLVARCVAHFSRVSSSSFKGCFRPLFVFFVVYKQTCVDMCFLAAGRATNNGRAAMSPCRNLSFQDQAGELDYDYQIIC